jgi:hypothetical protein
MSCKILEHFSAEDYNRPNMAGWNIQLQYILFLVIYVVYSRDRNKHTGMIINFSGFFQGLRPY